MTARRGIAAATSAVASLALVVLPAAWVPAGAQTAPAAITEVGWWTRNPTATAPADGFAVGRAPDGAVSVAALGVTGSGNVRRAVLLLREAGGVATEQASLEVCTTPNTWKAGTAQAWAEAPKPECTFAKAATTRHAATTTWSADVTNLVSALEDEGRADLMVVPAAAGQVPLFEVRFGKPELQVEAAPEEDDRTSTFPPPSDSGSGSGSGSGFTSSSPPDDAPSTAFEGGAAPSGAALPTPASVAPAAGSDAASTGDGAAAGAGEGVPAELASLPTQAAAGVDGDGERSLAQALFFLVVATVAGVAAGGGRWFLRQRSADGAFG